MAGADSDINWETCDGYDCIGVCLPGSSYCWAHAGQSVQDVTLKRLREGEELDARWVTFDDEQLTWLLTALATDDADHATLHSAKFTRATFQSHVRFAHDATDGMPRRHPVRFVGDADFVGATFEGSVTFTKAQFDGDVDFHEATFHDLIMFAATTVRGDADFREAMFNHDAVFADADVEGTARFEGVTFQQAATFTGAHFSSAQFYETTFRGRADFHAARLDHAAFTQANFDGPALFEQATLAEAQFNRSTFAAEASFRLTRFDEDARFNSTTFDRAALFDRTTFGGAAAFDSAIFEGAVWFDRALFDRNASFRRTIFRDDALFDSATVRGSVRFDRADFTGPQQLGPLLVDNLVWLDDAVFRDRVRIKASAAGVSCQRTSFLAGVHLQVRWAEVVLDDADLSAPSIVHGAQSLGGPQHRPHLGDGDERRPRPQLLSVQRANVAGLTLAGVDLLACQFAGAHHLDRLRMDECDFGATPEAWWRTSRQAIAEEHHWRSAQDGNDANPGETDRDWYSREYWPSIMWSGDDDTPPPSPAQVAAIYRELRKGREDNKDEPGAADFYYGEMEMRRHATGRRSHAELRVRRRRPAVVGEHYILVAYWLLSGYGLRAWRALASLAAVVLVASVALALWGFGDPGVRPVDVTADGAPIYAEVDRPRGLDELPTAVRISAQAATALLRGPDVALNATGEVIHIVLRIAGPLLLGLAVLSVRGRVKR